MSIFLVRDTLLTHSTHSIISRIAKRDSIRKHWGMLSSLREGKVRWSCWRTYHFDVSLCSAFAEVQREFWPCTRRSPVVTTVVISRDYLMGIIQSLLIQSCVNSRHDGPPFHCPLSVYSSFSCFSSSFVWGLFLPLFRLSLPLHCHPLQREVGSANS